MNLDGDPKRPVFEILDTVDTPIGVLGLRRRELLGRPGTVVTEVTIDHEMLMSSLNTVSEEALATRALALHGGSDLAVLVGGLGLGYTAQAALATGQVARLTVVEYLPAVSGWLERGLLPLSSTLGRDARLEIVHDDVYARLLRPGAQAWDAIIIDVDHTPDEPLDPSSAPFYTATGLARVKEHLRPGGVLAVWSAGDAAPRFVEALREVFDEARSETVRWTNELIDEGQELEDVLFLARRSV